MAGYLRITLACVSGLLLSASFPSLAISYLAWIALVPLLLALNSASFGSGFRLGFIAGIIHYLTLMYWLVPTMRTYGHLPLFLAIPLLFLLSAYMGGYVALFSGILARFAKSPVIALAGAPFIWIALEYARSNLFTGFPWELLGHSQFNRLHLIQLCDIFGVYGLSGLILFSNVTVALLLLSITRKSWNRIRITNAVPYAGIGFLIFFLSASWLYGRLYIRKMDHLASIAPYTNISVIQGNIEQAIKWDPAFQVGSVQKYIDLSLLTQNDQPDLIVWPETAVPFYLFYDIPISERVLKGIKEIKGDFLIGSPYFTRKKEEVGYYNSAFLIGSDGRVYGRYDKAHLVPYGEYVPLREWFPFIGKMVENFGDFQAGTAGAVIEWRNTKVGPLICYEVIFPYLSRKMVQNGASFLVNITNDAWYGKTSAPEQHFSIAVFRAVENRRALVRSANTGVSGFIDPCGRILAETPIFEEAVMTKRIALMTQISIYTRFGDWFPKGCVAFVLLGGCIGLTNWIYGKKKRS
ncbi:MAG: apolipoprotein N-acyltransferase [Deltaproteobacteria bacterium RBG_13_49_15]|nr:MAG: apolipoprotein N-acyltransferase [Deltaproteobacteria bacterium RBG_13_49_15]